MTSIYHPRPERWPQFGLKKGMFALIAMILYVFDPELALIDAIQWFGNRRNRKPRVPYP